MRFRCVPFVTIDIFTYGSAKKGGKRGVSKEYSVKPWASILLNAKREQASQYTRSVATYLTSYHRTISWNQAMQWTQSSLNTHNSFWDSKHPRTLGPTQLKRSIPSLSCCVPMESHALVCSTFGSLDAVRPCSVLRPLPAKTRRDSILPAPLFLLYHFYPMLWPRISAVFERYGRRVIFLSTLPGNLLINQSSFLSFS